MLEVTDKNFEIEILAHPGLAVVDFFGTWCGPCKQFRPIFEEFAAEVMVTVKVARADIDKCPEHTAKSGIMSVPTIMFFFCGEAVEKFVGVQSKDFLLEKVKEIEAK